MVTLITQCYLQFQHIKIIQKIRPKSAVFFKSKTVWSHLKSRSPGPKRHDEQLNRGKKGNESSANMVNGRTGA